ncbi:hypothetical protein [Nonomuraea sp. NPDC049646]|uniref:hypothetical protein n=1 Tax=unclassified Nonomuraea TaxID=2593643 RepID=UPI0037900AF6
MYAPAGSRPASPRPGELIAQAHEPPGIPREQLSRVIATSSVAGSVLVPLFSAFADPLADAVGVRVVLAGCATVVVAGAAAASGVHDVRRLGTTNGRSR